MSQITRARSYCWPALLLCVAMLLVLRPSHAQAAPPKARVGSHAPRFDAVVVKGGRTTPLSSRELKGSTVVLEFCTTWCAPCEESIKRLTALHEQFSHRGVRIIRLSNETPGSIDRFLESHPVPFDVATDPSGKAFESYAISSVPIVLLIDDSGVIRWIGSARQLTGTALDRFLKAGDLPRRWFESTTQPTPRELQKALWIQISQSRRLRATIGTTIQKDEESFSFRCENLPIPLIIRTLLSVPQARLRVAAGVPNHLYDVTYVHVFHRGKPESPQPLIDALCRVAGLRLSSALEDREVWVARHSKKPLPMGAIRSTGGIDPVTKIHHFWGMTTKDFFNSLESSFGELICDEAECPARYNLWYRADDEFEKVRAHLDREFGITLSKERRKIEIFLLAPVEKHSSPGGKKQQATKKEPKSP